VEVPAATSAISDAVPVIAVSFGALASPFVNTTYYNYGLPAAIVPVQLAAVVLVHAGFAI